MKDQNKTKAQLIVELEEARQRVSKFEQSKTEWLRVEDALRESRERYRELFEMVPACLWEEDFSNLKNYLDKLRSSGVTDLQTYFQTHPEELLNCANLVEIVDVNETTVQLSGVESKEQLLGRLDKLFIDDSYSSFQNEIIALYEQGGVFQGENVNISPQGNLIYSEINGKIAAGYEDTWGKYLVAQMDITERKQVELELKESEERFRSIFDTEPECVKILNPDTTLVTMNPAGLAMIEAESLDMVKGHSVLPIIDEEFRDGFRILTDNVCKKEQSGMFEFRIIGLKGTPRWLETHAVPLCDSQGEVIGLLGVTRDITERKQAEDALQERESELQSIFRAAPIGIGMTINRVIQEANQMLCKMTGYTRDELVGQNARMLYLSTEDYEYVGHEKYSMIKEQGVGTIETQWKRKDGDIRDILLSSVPIESGDFSKGVTFTALDITERKQAEEMFRIIYESAPDAHYIYNLKGVFVEGNKAAERITGYRKDELIGTNFLKNKLLPKRQLPKAAADLAKNRLGKPTGPDEFTIIRKDGSQIEVEIVTHPIIVEGETLVLGTARDITERKQAELAVIESEERYRNIVESSPLGMHLYELQNSDRLVFVGANPAADKILKVDNSIFVGKTIEEAFPPLIGTEVPERYKAAAKKGAPWKTEQIDYDADGIKGAFEVVAFQTSPNKMVAMFQDITVRKQAEDALRMKTGELETLFSISKHLRAARSADEMLPLVVKEMRSVLQADTSAIILLNPDEEHFRYAFGDGALAANIGKKFIADQSISGMVLQTNKPYVTVDLSSDPIKASGLKGTEGLGPAVVVPLLSEEDFLGVLVCARTKELTHSHFSTSEVQLLTAIGEMVGNALRRAGLFDQALTRLQNVQALRSIDMAISANMELSIILEVLLAQGVTQLDVDAASVLLLDPHTHTLEYEAGYGFRTKAVESAHLRIGEGLPGEVALKRKILYVPNLSKSKTLLRKNLLKEEFVSYHAAPLIAKGQLQGVLEIFSRTPIAVNDEQTSFLETLATQAAIAIDNAQLFVNLQRSNFELEMAYNATIEGWSRALELRDQETEGHTLRVAKMTVGLAQAMGVKSEEIIHIRRGALLHDIGKMGVPDHILLKPGKLDDEEWELMKQHTDYAFAMLHPIDFLRLAIDIPHCHHERWDGNGYPRGLNGEQIPLAARIFAVVDVWDALNSDRPYRKAWTEEKALDYITANAGKHFDPQVVEQFLNFLNDND